LFGLDESTAVGIVGIIVSIVLVAIPGALYAVGTLRPLAVRATARTLPHKRGGHVTEVVAVVRSRTRNTQTITEVALAKWPRFWERLLHPRWRTKRPFDVQPFDWKSLTTEEQNRLEVPGHDERRVSGQISVYPPFQSTRIIVKGPRKRPLIKKIKQLR
jgi:hypothetical protein